MPSERSNSGLWAALFIILLLPLLFLRQGGQSISLSAPHLGLPPSLPRARTVWDYQAGAREVPVWLGGALLGQQAAEGAAPAVLVAVSAQGEVLWREEVSQGFTAVTNGREVLVADQGGRLLLLNARGAPVWAQPSACPAQVLALSPRGHAAAAEGPLAEAPGNLLERVRFYDRSGTALGEYPLRNSSALALLPSADGWLLSTVALGSRETESTLAALNEDGTRFRTFGRSADLIQAVASGPEGVAAAGGRRVQIFLRTGEAKELSFTNPVSHLAWAADGRLLVVEGGGSGAAPARLSLLGPDTRRVWQRRLRGPCRGLYSRTGLILVADTSLVYALTPEGDLKWCYEAPATVKTLAPLAESAGLVVELERGRLQLVEPPVPTD